MGTIERPVRQALVRATLHLVNRSAPPAAARSARLGRGANPGPIPAQQPARPTD
jgi:hypothetical protein